MANGWCVWGRRVLHSGGPHGSSLRCLRGAFVRRRLPWWSRPSRVRPRCLPVGVAGRQRSLGGRPPPRSAGTAAPLATAAECASCDASAQARKCTSSSRRAVQALRARCGKGARAAITSGSMSCQGSGMGSSVFGGRPGLCGRMRDSYARRVASSADPMAKAAHAACLCASHGSAGSAGPYCSRGP